MRIFYKLLAISVVMSFALGAYVTKAPVKMSKINTKYKNLMEKSELNTVSALTTSDRTPIYYPQSTRDENYSSFTLVDSSMNGYGLIVAPTKPLDVTDDGWLMVYRQFVEYPGGFSGQLGSAYSSDGENWTTYTNINNGGPATASPMARYPSAVMGDNYPYAFWNEYTGSGNPSYGGRPYYAWDQFGFGGGSWAAPEEGDPLWGTEKDLWVLSPAHSSDETTGEHFNFASADWTRGEAWVFTSEYVDPSGQVIFAPEQQIIDETTWLVGGDDTGSYTSSPVLAFNDAGVGYVGVTAYWEGADVNASPYDNYHTLFFRTSDNHGASWSNTGSHDNVPYYTITDDVMDAVMANYFGTGFYDECDQVDYVYDGIFMAYDFDMKVDSDGNPHIVVGVLPQGPDPVSGDSYIFPSQPGSGFYYFTIDKENLDNPGTPCDLGSGDCGSSTGWKFSFVTAADDCWSFQTASGGSYWQVAFPSLAISEEDESTIWVVSTLLVPGEGDDPTPEDECDFNTMYNFASEDVIVNKSSNGGQSWLGEYNISSTPADPSTELDDWAENSAHAGSGATNDRVNVMYQMPKWEWNTTGDPDGPDHTCRLYTGYVEYTSEILDYVLGDANCDSQVTVQDIIALVQHILGTSSIDCGEGNGLAAADYNADGIVSVTDILEIVNYILTETKSEKATFVHIINNDNSVNFDADGEVGAFDITISHDADFELSLTNDALVALSETTGNKTRMIIILPGSESLFTSEGNFEIVELVALSKDGEIEIIQPNKLNISEAYPNPFNPVTTMQLSLEQDGYLNISVFNIAGQLVDVIHNGNMVAGYHQISWNASEVSSGLYIVKANDGVNVVSQKVMLLK